jgi:hypothetical protein
VNDIEMEIETKQCSGCPLPKPIAEFSMCKGRRRSICKACDARAGKVYREKCKRERAAFQANRATAAESPAEAASGSPQGQPTPGKGIAEPACICSLTVAVKDGYRLYGTNPACPVEEHKRIIGGYEPHKAQKPGAQVKYNGMVHGY